MSDTTAETAGQADSYTVKLASGETFGPASMTMIVQWAREGRVPATASLLTDARPPIPVSSVPELAPLLVGAAGGAGAVAAADAGWSSVIPYRNAPALIGYYLSVFSILPGIGLLLGPTAIVLGSIGLYKRKRNPLCKGLAHALIAIILGLIGSGISLALLSAWFLV